MSDHEQLVESIKKDGISIDDIRYICVKEAIEPQNSIPTHEMVNNFIRDFGIETLHTLSKELFSEYLSSVKYIYQLRKQIDNLEEHIKIYQETNKRQEMENTTLEKKCSDTCRALDHELCGKTKRCIVCDVELPVEYLTRCYKCYYEYHNNLN